MIELHNLSCSFKNKQLLTNITQSIPKHISILGANGSGKSTLAKAICNLVKYDGEITIMGEEITTLSLKDRAKMLSYIPAKLEIHDPYISVYEFVLQGRFPYKQSYSNYSYKDNEITKQTLEFLKISHLENISVSSLSSGEQQLVLIAQALTQQSKIIIFDEPTANLDPHNSKLIAEHIKGLKEYHQIILITHDLHLACYIDSPVLFLKDKQLSYYEKEFFDDDVLQKLYGVNFHSMALQYD